MNLGQSLLPAQAGNQNTFLGDSFLNSKFLDPGYLFDQILEFLRFLFDLIVYGGGGGVFKLILAAFSIFFLTVIAYTSVRLLEIRSKEKKHLEHEIAEYAHHQAEREKKLWGGETEPRNERWVKVLQLLFSPNSGDWKLAIIEADSMLEVLMGDLGFKGETFGDKLKSADRDKFRNITSAWEVHTIRNRIAHEGASFELSQHEAKRVIALYEQIFREFGYI
ncbi:hypothetical protein A2911_02740 [Candidatus Nomurabacteria bacterium RIFCSPLOWO2_01_FULL_40_15]|uniref:Uncharacterized protein n=1 Tax=Candidatus Nomurabacteria bacterium RIFCSPLOWO2_01_FULL_40_15 TaxID=1801772 RepID=A0A1F6X930_9BACT|nr:MAG: hypothetical protein A2911_02740 [Candidatus Nomurabacteria bacterium RIFCSPLOWO2_01_FULL_40_15]